MAPSPDRKSNKRQAGLGVFSLAACMILAYVWLPTGSPRAAGTGPDAQQVRTAYSTYCCACHGATGRGNGVLAKAYDPPVPDFSRIVDKDRSDEWLMAAILDGGAAVNLSPVLPGWRPTLAHLGDADQWAAELATHVRGLGQKSAAAQRAGRKAAEQETCAPAQIELGQQPTPAKPEAVKYTALADPFPEISVKMRKDPTMGAHSSLEMTPSVQFFKQRCTGCHGPQGRGNGPVACGLEPKPADLARIIDKRRSDLWLKSWILKGSTYGSATMHPAWGYAFLEEAAARARAAGVPKSESDTTARQAVYEELNELIIHIRSLAESSKKKGRAGEQPPAPTCPDLDRPPREAAPTAENVQAEYQRHCCACHGPEGRGNGDLGSHYDPPAPDFAQLIEENRDSEWVQSVILDGGSANGLSPSLPGWRWEFAAQGDAQTWAKSMEGYIRSLGNHSTVLKQSGHPAPAHASCPTPPE